MDDLVTSDSDSREDLSLQPTPPNSGEVVSEEKDNALNHQNISEGSGLIFKDL